MTPREMGPVENAITLMYAMEWLAKYGEFHGSPEQSPQEDQQVMELRELAEHLAQDGQRAVNVLSIVTAILLRSVPPLLIWESIALLGENLEHDLMEGNNE
jgi:hypothetical protein